MVLDFAKLDLREPPVLILKNAGGTPIGVLSNVIGLAPGIKYNETSVIEFELPYSANGVICPCYDEVVGTRIVEMKDIGQFILLNPKEVNDGVDRRKKCKAYSLEYEFVFKKITIGAGTYNFYNPYGSDETIMDMILKMMPAWRIGSISESLVNKYRTIEADCENIYNLIKDRLQESFGCIFDFDTISRLINVRDVSDSPKETTVYISTANLAKEIVVEENTEDIVTRLDVNGADGVNIRNVNPTGSNQIINLDHFMNTINFSSDLISKYYAWKELIDDNMEPFYSLSTDYTLSVMQKATAEAELTELQGELKSLESQQAVTIQAIAQALQDQEDLDEVNALIVNKQSEIDAQKQIVASAAESSESIMRQMETIRDTCRYENYFSTSELLELNPYLKDGDITDSTFVVIDTNSYNSSDVGERIDSASISITESKITRTDNLSSRETYTISGGVLQFGSGFTGSIVSATLEWKENNAILASFRLNGGSIKGVDFPSGCITISGTGSSLSHNLSIDSDVGNTYIGSEIAFICVSGYSYFTYNVSTYDQHSVEWDLYQYGYSTLQKLSQPAYIFNVSSANFFSMDEFLTFKNSIELGQKLYVELSDGRVLSPICIGAEFDYDDPESLKLEFGDSYTSSDSTFRLVDLLNKSVSMGKNVDASKYVNSAYVDSGAEVGIKAFINSALDVAKNAIMSSSDQAISWDSAGLRLRKWANDDQTSYEDEQIWMSNNSIMMTDDGWNTAELAIGKFYDENLGGEFWGIVASRIFGTIIAGSNLLIESEKKDGGVATFRVDADGCRLYNADLAIASETRHIVLNPDVGIAMGKFPVYNIDEASGNITLDNDNVNFYVDDKGNVFLRGEIEATDGTFHGDVIAKSLTIISDDESTDLDSYLDSKIDSTVGTKIEEATDELDEKYNTLNGQLANLTDTVDGKSTIYYGDESPINIKSGDLWITTSGVIYRCTSIDADGSPVYVQIQDSELSSAIDGAVDLANTKINVYASAEEPALAAYVVGDLWIDTDDNTLHRWNGTAWILHRDSWIHAMANDDYDGLYFTGSNVSKVELNEDVGLKVSGAAASDGSYQYFQAMDSALGFFAVDSNEKTHSLMYCEDGSLYLTGTIYAEAGVIGSATDTAWKIGSEGIYSGSTASIDTTDGTYIGTDGISIRGSFVVRGVSGTSDDQSEFDIFRVSEIITESDETYYQMYIGKEVAFSDDFAIQVKNGGTGAQSKIPASRNLGHFRAISESDMQLYGDASDGDICVLYPGNGGTETATITGYTTTTSPSSGPGYLSMARYDASGHYKTSYFGISVLRWNVWGLADEYEDMQSNGYCRIGAGYTPSATSGYYCPYYINTGGVKLSSIGITFQYNLKPSGADDDLCSTIENGIKIKLFNGTTEIANAEFMPSSTKPSNTLVTATAVLQCISGYTISTGTYYIVLYSNNTKSLMFLKLNAAKTLGVISSGTDSGESAEVTMGLYIHASGGWQQISGDSGGSGFVLSPASTTVLGGVIIGDGLSVDEAGKISVSSQSASISLGYEKVDGSQTVVGKLTATSGENTNTVEILQPNFRMLTAADYGDSLPTDNLVEGRIFFKKV